uniref:Leucine-rich repeat-containing protein 71 n=1 Tax=Leptobrachium leishanense TaxID=445787 RepID=A0A8C5QTH8_9ANUR
MYTPPPVAGLAHSHSRHLPLVQAEAWLRCYGYRTPSLPAGCLESLTEFTRCPTALASLDRSALTAEEYQCTGVLEQDFIELCLRMGYIEVPKIMAHPTPATLANEETDSVTDGPAGAGQTTDRFSFFRPKVQVVLESDDPKSVRELHIRGWKIDEKMMGILAKCLPALASLHTISWWNVGLTEDTFSWFLRILRQCPCVRLTSITLRTNMVDDEGARLISQALQSLQVTNKNLVSLNLAFNHVSDRGAGYIAEALRLHRSLLSLNLAGNRVGDKGALALAEILRHFPLTHKEIVERRKILMEKELQKQPRSPATSQHEDSKSDRPPSHQNTEKSQAAKAMKVSGKKKEKDTPKKEDKSTTNNHATSSTTSLSAQAKKEDTKAARKQLANPDPKPVRGKPVKSATKRGAVSEQEPEPSEVTNPLLEAAESRHGQIFLYGNKVLMNLNVSGNRITEDGLSGFLSSMETQVRESKLIPGTRTPTGLLRLSLARNSFSPSSPVFLRLQELMLGRDPTSNPPSTEETAKDPQ